MPRRWRNEVDATVAAETKQSAEDAMGVEEFAGRGRAIGTGERDIDDGVGFFAARLDPARR